MMFIWIPFLFVALLVAWWSTREDGHGASGGVGKPIPVAHRGRSQVGHSGLIEIARQRLARGEITAEEYVAFLRALR